MSCRKVWSLLFPVYLCVCHVLSEHACGENPLRRFASLKRMLNDLYPGREIDPAMGLLRESNPELHRRLQPVVSLLQSEWRLYTDCVTMVDNGYFKRSDSWITSRNQDREELESSMKKKTEEHNKENFLFDMEDKSKLRLIDIINQTLAMHELPPLHDSSARRASKSGQDRLL